ncbi:MAG: FmdB family zinc ribbon protein [Candidatus Limnocylindria bacterium]
MPIYDHMCDHCGHAFSVVRAYTDPPVDACPSCGKKPRRVLTAPAIVFKGSGWYKTDSRASSAPAKQDGAKPEAGAAAKIGDAKPGDAKSSEAKPAAKGPTPAGEAAS